MIQYTDVVAGYPIDAVIWEKDNRVLPVMTCLSTMQKIFF